MSDPKLAGFVDAMERARNAQEAVNALGAGPDQSDADIEVQVINALAASRAKVTLDRKVHALEGWYLQPGETYSVAYLVHQLGMKVLDIPLVRQWAHTLREMIRSQSLVETSWAEGADNAVPEVGSW